ncbi:MAG: hypothetical protein ABID71_01135 [Chloroflexota bacterium]
MRIKGLKGFQLGKSKNKAVGKDAPAEDNTASQIAEMEEQMSTRTKGLEATAQQLQELSGAAGEAGGKEAAAGPHGPLGELEVAPDDNGEDIGFDSVINVAGTPGGAVEVVKMAEVGGPVAAPAASEEEQVKVVAATAEAPPAEAAAAAPAKPEGDDSFNNLFSDEEEDENPLANLINGLPDVTTEELLDDLKEIKEIIQEWQQS